ncbi:MAG: hypothetical protein RLZZ301_1389 [Bacteroidota bacterium]|jgi:hypothetical protein
MKKHLLLGAAFFSLSMAQAQLQLSEIHLSNGAFSGTETGTLAQFQSLAPQSSILQQDLSLYHFDNAMRIGGMGGSSQSLQLGFKTAAYPTALLRIGLSNYSNANAYHLSGEYSESFIVDTLTSSVSGQQTYIDSSSYHHIGATYGTQQLRLDAALLFRMRPEKRWSLQGGIGASLGYAYRNTIRVSSSVDPYSLGGFDMFFTSSFFHWSGQTETFASKGGLGASIYVPLGIDFRIGKKREFWTPIHLYAEMRPSLFITTYGKNSPLTPSFSVGSASALGLRIDVK